jgi:hypothetical protein
MCGLNLVNEITSDNSVALEEALVFSDMLAQEAANLFAVSTVFVGIAEPIPVGSARESWSSAWAMWYFLYRNKYCAPNKAVAIRRPLRKRVAAMWTAVNFNIAEGITPILWAIGTPDTFDFLAPATSSG